jgi:hypothetical protein
MLTIIYLILRDGRPKWYTFLANRPEEAKFEDDEEVDTDDIDDF